MENNELVLDEQIKNALPQDIRLEGCKESAFLKVYTFSTEKGGETITAYINFYYNAKGKITKICPSISDDFSKFLIEKLQHITHLCAKPIDEYEFPEEFLKDLFESIKTRIGKESIVIKGEHPQDFPYKQRYTFQKDNLIAIFDFIYNKDGDITAVINILNNYDSSEFVEQLKTIFREILNNS